MKISVQSMHFDADKKLVEFINVKLNKLIQYSEDIISAEVMLKLDNTDERENKVVEIKLDIPKINDIFVKKQSKSFEESINLASQSLSRQIIKAKEKLRSN